MVERNSDPELGVLVFDIPREDVKIGIPDLHIHDLKHTVEMRQRALDQAKKRLQTSCGTRAKA